MRYLVTLRIIFSRHESTSRMAQTTSKLPSFSSKIVSFVLTRGLTSDNTPRFHRGFIFDKKCLQLKFHDSVQFWKRPYKEDREKLFDFFTSFSQFLTSSQRSFQFQISFRLEILRVIIIL